MSQQPDRLPNPEDAEEALRTCEDNYRMLFDSMAEGFADCEIVRDEGGRVVDLVYLDLNRALERQTGLDRDSVLGRRMSEVLPLPDSKWWATFYGGLADSAKPSTTEQYIEALGRWIEVSAYPRGGDQVAVFYRDVTARKRAEAALRESEERQAFFLKLSDALRPLADAAEITATATRILAEQLGVNRAFYAKPRKHYWFIMKGYEKGIEPLPQKPYRISTYGQWILDEFNAGHTLIVCDMGTDRRFQPSERAAHEALQIGAQVAVPLVKREKMAGMLVVQTSTPRDWTDYEIAFVTETAERTWAAVERVKAEKALHKNEDRLRLALSAARMGTWSWNVNADAHLRDANLNRLFGLPAAITSTPFGEFLSHIHSEDRRSVRTAFEHSVRHGEPLSIEFRVVWPDGTVHWLQDQGDFLKANSKTRMAGVCRDVTEQREAREALRASEERLRRIVEAATVYAILTLDRLRRITSWSPGAEAIFGYSAREVRGRPVDFLFTCEDIEAGIPELEAWDSYRQSGVVKERWYVRKNGSRFFASGMLSPLGPGGTDGYVKMLQDLTERKLAEDELREARDLLDKRVETRTAELLVTLESLEAEIDRRRDLARKLSTAQEDERQRVSRELHDSVAQLMTGLSLAFKAIETSGPLSEATVGKLADAQRVADSLGKEVHALAVRLRPTALDDLGLEPALRQLVNEWSPRVGVQAELTVVGFGAGRLAPEIETAVYRIVQEALTNVAKHARASRASVVVSRLDENARIMVEDDGAGFALEDVPKGRLGLLGIRERAELVGGKLGIESCPGLGTTLFVTIPVKPT